MRAKWWPYFVAVLLTICACALGRWQLNRADEKTMRARQMVAQTHAVALDGAGLDNYVAGTKQSNLQNAARLIPSGKSPSGILSTDMLFRRIYVRGVWQPHAVVYLDNRPNSQGQAGMEVVMPLRLDTGKVLLINRGWLPRDAVWRTRIAHFSTPSGWVPVEGRLLPYFDRVYALGGQEPDIKNAPLRQNVKVADFAGFISDEMYPFVARQEGGTQDGLLRRWAVIDSGVSRHYGYAFQWFSFAALIVGLTFYFGGWRGRSKWWSRDRDKKSHEYRG
ncbi:MAG: SURF1 family protein [Ottowia sp.]|nr:SURF1 family protein [Ottowia sp.]